MVKLKEEEKRQAIAEKKATETEVTQKKEVKEKVVKEAPIKIDATLEDLEIVYYPLVTEKSVNMIDTENKITFIVSDKGNKENVKRIFEKAYKVKVEKINMIRDRKGRKKAIVKLKKEFKAEELATRLGVL